MRNDGKKLFGERLTRLRVEKGYSTQEDFALALGVPLSTYKKWEQGAKTPQEKNLLKILTLTGVDPEYFTGEIEKKTHDLQFICEYTGLTEKAAEVLHYLSAGYMDSHKENLEILNYILESQYATGDSSGDRLVLENKENILYKVRECLSFKKYFPGADDNTHVALAGMDGPVLTVGEMNKSLQSHYFSQVTEFLSGLRRKKDFYKWQNGIKEYKHRIK